ncbi:organic solute transporter alpha-like protein [Phlebotomus argentipes]|uniref:organic solute transporter alpha-like protein n=1 Tax=Phlebotomus argentipes TaxID=94469 RepID=UPI002892B94F|nr:organic solute transporter alpha-like protein [Phlebotomus argentipes]
MNSSTLRPFEESECSNDAIPSFYDYVTAMTPLLMGLTAAGGALFLVTLTIFYRNLNKLVRRTPKDFLARTLMLCGIYQIVSAAAFVSILVPRAILLCDTVAHLTFAFCTYQLICLFIDYAAGETNFIKQANRDAFSLRTPPCCCCCWCCLHPGPPSKAAFLLVRTLVLQFPIVQGVLFITLNVLFVENNQLYSRVFLYFLPFIITSIILCIWGLNIIVRMMAPCFPDLHLRAKYFALQFVLMMTKIQPGIGNAIVANIEFPCWYPLTPALYKNIIVQIIILTQMVILSVWAQKLYRTPSKSSMKLSMLS